MHIVHKAIRAACGHLRQAVTLPMMIALMTGSLGIAILAITPNADQYEWASSNDAMAEFNLTDSRTLLDPAKIRAVGLKLKSNQSLRQTQTFEDSSESITGSTAFNNLYKVIKSEIRAGRPTYAVSLLKRDPMAQKLKDAEYDRLLAIIAQSYLSEGQVARALNLAQQSVRRSGDEVPMAGWVGGLAAWRMGQFDRSQDLFTKSATAKGNNPWSMAASAYWASRAALRARHFEDVEPLLDIAANHPRTFYGLIATRALGRDYDFEWDLPELSSKQSALIETSPAVQEAVRVAKSGHVDQALGLLSAAGFLESREKRIAILVYAAEHKAPALAMHLARSTKTKHGKFIDAALYPETPWSPDNGFNVDRSLINALIRQESRFNPNATSGAGAAGLMQIMPQTAAFMTNGNEDVALNNPNTNLAVGQNYVRHLLQNELVNNDLFAFAIAYNAGPGNLSKWQRELGKIKDDPLLFIESIPVAETRAYVERVVVNYWIYRIRDDHDVPSLDAIASGEASRYQTAGRLHEILAMN